MATALGPRVSELRRSSSAPLAVGGVIGALLAARVAMTAMPQLVAILHSFVGAAAVLVGFATYLDPSMQPDGHRGSASTRSRSSWGCSSARSPSPARWWRSASCRG